MTPTNPDAPADITRAQARDAAVLTHEVHASVRGLLVPGHPILAKLCVIAATLGYPIVLVRPKKAGGEDPALDMKGPIEQGQPVDTRRVT